MHIGPETNCPDCGASRGCYSCVTQGGWQSPSEDEEAEREEQKASAEADLYCRVYGHISKI